jgi:hypothetical protein
MIKGLRMLCKRIWEFKKKFWKELICKHKYTLITSGVLKSYGLEKDYRAYKCPLCTKVKFEKVR